MPNATEHQWAVDLATELLDTNGRAMTLTEVVRMGPASNRVETTVDHAVVGVQTKYLGDEIDGTNILRTDMKVLIDSRVKPTVDMRLVDGVDEYSIKNVDVVAPGTLAILYRVQARA